MLVKFIHTVSYPAKSMRALLIFAELDIIKAKVSKTMPFGPRELESSGIFIPSSTSFLLHGEEMSRHNFLFVILLLCFSFNKVKRISIFFKVL